MRTHHDKGAKFRASLPAQDPNGQSDPDDGCVKTDLMVHKIGIHALMQSIAADFERAITRVRHFRLSKSSIKARKPLVWSLFLAGRGPQALDVLPVVGRRHLPRKPQPAHRPRKLHPAQPFPGSPRQPPMGRSRRRWQPVRSIFPSRRGTRRRRPAAAGVVHSAYERHAGGASSSGGSAA